MFTRLPTRCLKRASASASGSLSSSLGASVMVVTERSKALAKALDRKPRSRSPISRRLEAKHGRHVGEVVIAWNDLQGSLFMIFWALLGKSHAVAHGIWHTIQSDKTQREMLAGVAKADLEDRPKALESVMWLLKAAAALSSYRNDSAHTPIMPVVTATGTIGVAPNMFSGRGPAIERLVATPLDQVWRRVRGDLYALARYGQLIAHVLMSSGGASPPWPRRPRLLAVRVSNRKGGPAHRRPPRAKRKPPLKP